MIPGTFCIRRAEEYERHALSESFLPRSSEADIFLAENGETKKSVGGGAIWFTPNRRFPETATCIVQIAESHRRSGIGRALLENLVRVAREVGVKQLRSSPLEEKSPGFQFALACGFKASPPTIIYEASIDDCARVTQPIYERLRKRGKIPDGAQVLPLSEAPREDVCRLVLDNLGFSSEHVAQRLRGTEHGFSQTISRVALIEGKLVGAILITYQKALASVDATAVLRQHRHTWVNAALKYSLVEELIARDVKMIRFSANSADHPDTANMAARPGGHVGENGLIAVTTHGI